MDWVVRRAGVARCTTVACAVGLALSALAGACPALGMGGLVVALLVTLFGVARPVRRVLVAALVLLGFFAGYLVGSVRVEALEASTLRGLVEETVTAELVITGAVRESSGWLSASAEVRKLGGSPGGEGEAVLLEVPPTDGAGDLPPLVQGMIVTLTARVKAPEGPSDSGFDQANQLRHQGISVIFQADRSAIRIVGLRGGVSGWFDRLRAGAADHLSRGPDARVDEVLQGVVMGDTQGIDEDWLVAFRRSGTAHMLSVSGLHVGALAAMMLGLMRLLRAPRWAGFLAAAAAAFLLIPFVGASPPVVRAAVMLGVVLAGRWVGRSRDQWQVLALAAVAVLVLNPFAVFDVGFQLSFAAFVGMLVLLRPLTRLFHGWPDALASGVAVSVAASIGTAPVALLTFGQISLVAPLANLLVVPALPVITGLGMASAVLGCLWHGLSAALDWLVSLPVMWTVLVCRLMARAPVLATSGLGRGLSMLVSAAVTLPLALALAGRAPRVPFGLHLPFFGRVISRVRSRRPRQRRFAVLAACGVVVVGLLLGLAAYPVLAWGTDTLVTAAHRAGWPTDVELRVLDVGQGNAMLIRTPAHKTLLFDGGPEGCDLAGQLRSLGVDHLDLVVISHPHADHFAGLLEAVGTLHVATLIDHVQIVADSSGGVAATVAGPVGGGVVQAGSTYWKGEAGSPSEASDYLQLRRDLAERGCRYIPGANGSTFALDGLTMRLFAPERPVVLVDGPDPWVGKSPPSGDELNGDSLVALMSVGSTSVLLPGDAEADVLSRYPIPSGAVLVVPHHGSRGGVTADLLRKWGTRVAVISVGENNPFGHPNPQTVSALEQGVGTVLRTDTSGWVSCTIRGNTVSITTERKPTR
jgi:competence protein ComEC